MPFKLLTIFLAGILSRLKNWVRLGSYKPAQRTGPDMLEKGGRAVYQFKELTS